MSAPSTGLRLRGLRRVYPGPVTALVDLDLDVAPGELVAVLGPSGSGKSTLLRVIAGLEPPDAGEVLLDGVAQGNRPPRERDVAIVFQSHSLFPHLRAFDNVAFGLRLRGVGEAEVRGRVLEAARALGVAGLLERMPHALSGGERQRLALARALVRKPRVFLLDEPLSGVDANHRAALRAEVRRVHSELRAVTIVVTHDQGEALSLADRVVVLRTGRVEQAGAPLEVYRRPANAFVAGFVGTPPMNLIEGDLDSDGGEGVFHSSGFRLRLPEAFPLLQAESSRRVTLGLRPEHLRMVASSEAATAHGCLTAIEPLGPLVYARLRLDALAEAGRPAPEVTALAGDPPPPALGSRVALVADPTGACLFDTASGRALGVREP